MRYPVVRLAALAASLVALAAVPAEARIGESRTSLQSRLFAVGSLLYKDEAIINARMRGMAYNEFLPYIEGNADLEIYYKSSDGERRKRSEVGAQRMPAGWDLHVFFVNGLSAAEFYVRSQDITDEEVKALLVLQGGGRSWSRRETDGINRGGIVNEEPEQDPELMTAFGFTMLRNDGEVRAVQRGRTLIFTDSEFDAGLAKRRAEELERGAPESVRGF